MRCAGRISNTGLNSCGVYCARHTPLQTTDTAKLKAQESEALPLRQVHGPGLFVIDLDLELDQFLPQSLLYRFQQPVMPGVRVHQDHQIVSETHILDVCVRPATGDLFGPLQHSVHLIEVDIAE